MADWLLWQTALVFVLTSVVILFAGTRLSGIADRLADRTGLGEALTGAVLLGGATSFSGIATSITAAWGGHPQLAMSNAMGGIAAQTVFLAIADFTHRRVNLEHAAASLANLFNGSLLIALLGGVLAAGYAPNVTILGVHPITPVLAVGYIGGLWLARRTHHDPLWFPHQTHETILDLPAPEQDPASLTRLWVEFGIYAALLIGCGCVIAFAGSSIAASTGLGESLTGGLLTAVSTSTPELVTTIAAVRRGALTLAVGGVLGGNAFDVMFAVASDVAYRDGSIYHAISPGEQFLTALTVIMTAVLVMGMLARQKRGIGNIGFESATVLLLYVVGLVVLGCR